MTGQHVVPSAVKPPRGGHLPPPPGPASASAGFGRPSRSDLRRLGAMVALLDGMGLAERRRVLVFLTDRYGEASNGR